MEKIILDLCGGTGSWSAPYKENGYDVVVIDKDLPDECGTVFGDVALLDIVPINVVGILCAPPCTMFALSGNRWKRSEEDYKEALRIVDACLRLVHVYKPDFWALENPIGKLVRWLGKPKMYFQPCDYGDPWTKRTCLWGNFKMPKKNPVKPTEGSKMWAHYGGKSRRTKMMRSMTPPGFAQAFYEANLPYSI